MAQRVKEERTYEIHETENGWIMKLFEDGEEVGGGAGGPEDYAFLLESAEQFCG